MPLIRIICDYNIAGSLGENNNQEIVQVCTEDPEKITELVLSYITNKISLSLSAEELEDCTDWEEFEPKNLKDHHNN